MSQIAFMLGKMSIVIRKALTNIRIKKNNYVVFVNPIIFYT